jgi:hypothetical protein
MFNTIQCCLELVRVTGTADTSEACLKRRKVQMRLFLGNWVGSYDALGIICGNLVSLQLGSAISYLQ